uniref:NADH dehydrogenase subunit 5 n=1 Tax=Megacopta centronubila TaxID=2968963 RepID=UPI0022370947|nr:NADH dehydrogenase subunit 5 [Megacopta centronubila]UYA97701.1 NADH dehydrogenase subunit 5 [Megacopta centronubila]UYA97714.1 NADH dehydrogenase subunit 5 [Megacopta centronubila]
MINLCFYKLWSFFLFIFGSIFLFLGSFYIYDNYSVFFDWEFYSLNSVSIYMTFIFDWMSLIFMGCVFYISSMVVFYSSSYMSHDIFKYRFLLLVLLFIVSMMFLIISPNLFSILLGWDGLGLVSYCLVIYFQNIKSYNAGMLTVLTNRIGDVAILISIAWLLNSGGYNYYFCFYYSDSYSYWIGYLLLVAAFTKSAQIPFSSWLPAAMAAPTPVSALVHSSTLVTAGVYLLIRFYNLLFNIDLSYFLLISCLTMFMSGLGANFEFDLKKIIALSTLSQLGMMMSILFMGYPHLSYFHLLSHAFFKALLFLCAGLIIHSMSDSQDIRHMGYVINYLPFTCSCFCISNLSLCGFPFLSGFYSKDLILEYMSSGYFNLFIYSIFFLSVGLTACYSFRLIYYCVSFSSGLFPCQEYYESFDMMLSMIILAFMSITFGSIFSWLILPSFDVYFYTLECKLMPIIFVSLGSFLGYEISKLNLSNMSLGFVNMLIYNYFGSMWFMPSFSTYGVVYPTLIFSYNYSKLIDGGWCEYLISKSHFSFFSYLSKFFLYYHNNMLKFYLMSFLFWFMLLMFLFM